MKKKGSRRSVAKSLVTALRPLAGRRRTRARPNRQPRVSLAYDTNETYNNPRTTVVSQREYLDEIPCPCTAYKFSINPGMTETFSWLSRVSTLYEKYRILSMEIHYVPSVSATHGGQIVTAIDYDPDDAEDITLADLEFKATKTISNGRSPFKMRIDPKLVHQGRQWLFCRNTETPRAELHTYDACQLWIAATGDTAASFGKFYIDYRIMFTAPNLEVQASGFSYNVLGRTMPSDQEDIYGSLVPYQVADVEMTIGNLVRDIAAQKITGNDRWNGAFSNKWARVGQMLRDFTGRVTVNVPVAESTCLDSDFDPGYQHLGLLKSDSQTSGWVSAGDSAETVDSGRNQPIVRSHLLDQTQTIVQDVKLKKGQYVALGGRHAVGPDEASGFPYSASNKWSNYGHLLWQFAPTLVKLLTTAEVEAHVNAKKAATPNQSSSSSSEQSTVTKKTTPVAPTTAVPVESSVKKVCTLCGLLTTEQFHLQHCPKRDMH